MLQMPTRGSRKFFVHTVLIHCGDTLIPSDRQRLSGSRFHRLRGRSQLKQKEAAVFVQYSKAAIVIGYFYSLAPLLS